MQTAKPRLLKPLGDHTDPLELMQLAPDLNRLGREPAIAEACNEYTARPKDAQYLGEDLARLNQVFHGSRAYHRVHAGIVERQRTRLVQILYQPRRRCRIGVQFLRVQAEERWDLIPGGESFESLNQRLRRSIMRIAANHPDELVAAFVHGGVIGHILAHATGARPFAFNGADNGSISHIVVMGERILLRRFNDSTHLADTLSAGQSQMT